MYLSGILTTHLNYPAAHIVQHISRLNRLINHFLIHTYLTA